MSTKIILYKVRYMHINHLPYSPEMWEDTHSTYNIMESEKTR